MCGYCARKLNPDLIKKMKDELPDSVAGADNSNAPGGPALVIANAAIAGGGLQIEDMGISFQPIEGALSTGAWAGDNGFEFKSSASVDESGELANWAGRGLPKLAEQEVSPLSFQTADIPDTEYWTVSLALSFEDWHF
ncbi:hypothetical protein [Ruegeria sp. HKCCA6837]|uniref:hypothetical protein n=1 Tax=Ruegeria sp. HKCCA6837 TaxID=2682989 RepID=UPI001488BECB|nr:hypothetical protein [Ruegeria sp. HKCCA6837]